MKIADVRAMNADQLTDQLVELKREQFNLRFQMATGQMEKPHRFNEIRKDIARIQTVLRQVAPKAPPAKALAAKAPAAGPTAE